jgi:hypothetical protein
MAKSKAKASTSTSSSSSKKASNADSSYSTKSAKDFFNPTQFFNAGAFQSFQPANAQQFLEQLMESSQKNIEAFTACTQLAVERAKDLMEEQANFTNKMIQETASTFQETIANGSDPKEKMEEIAEYAKSCLEKTATAARKAAEENIQIAQKIGDTLSKRASECVEEIKSAA